MHKDSKNIKILILALSRMVAKIKIGSERGVERGKFAKFAKSPYLTILKSNLTHYRGEGKLWIIFNGLMSMIQSLRVIELEFNSQTDSRDSDTLT